MELINKTAETKNITNKIDKPKNDFIGKTPIPSYKEKMALENHNAISNKKNNETTSKVSVLSVQKKNFKDIFNDKEQLENYVKEVSPQFLEKFELLDYAKCGSAGAVMKGRPIIKGNKNAVGRLVALKFLNNGKEGHKSKSGQANHAEIMIHGSLRHKNIPQIYGYYKIGTNSCIAMEYSQYGDMENFKRRVIKRAPLSETLICYILGGLVEAVRYIHTHNKIIHMDIKQQNVLVDDYINIKLTDFSVSLNYKNLKKITLPMVGTCYYMSPEVLRKDTINASDASKIDVYSLGVLLYLLAFSDYPYKLKDIDNKDYAQILKNIETYELEFPKNDENSKTFLNLVSNCLEKDIKKRYNIYQVMNDPFTKGYQIILNEKEKLYNAGKFVIDLMVDNFLNFNQYIKETDRKFFQK